MKKGFLNFGRKLGFVRNKAELKGMSEAQIEQYKLLAQELGKALRPKPISVEDEIAMFEERQGGGQVYLYDFLQEAGDFGGGGWAMNDGVVPMMAAVRQDAPHPSTVAIDANALEKKEARIYKPIEVFSELERVPTKIDLENLADKILVMKMKKDCIKNNNYAKKEVIDMVLRFENRLKYNEHKAFFEKYDTTTTEKINALVGKYKLVLKSSDLFVPSFPKEAVLIMKEFTDTTKKLCGKKPVFYVIAEQKDFREQARRNDPILLAQSPFGIYWYILGAWDKELVLLEEL